MTTTHAVEAVSAPSFRSTARRFAEQIANYAAAMRRRRALATLAEMDDHLLDDIGLRRADIEWAQALPFGTDGTRELARIADARRFEAGWLRR